LSFADEVRRATDWPWKRPISYKTAVFRQVNKGNRFTHHDALEFPDGKIVLLTFLEVGQQATVLQLPVTGETARVPEPEKAKA
jgi:hypothetical protein